MVDKRLADAQPLHEFRHLVAVAENDRQVVLPDQLEDLPHLRQEFHVLAE